MLNKIFTVFQWVNQWLYCFKFNWITCATACTVGPNLILGFLVACYASLHPALSVRWSVVDPLVHRSVRWSIGPAVGHIFWEFFLRFLASLLLLKWSVDLNYGPCPPARDWGSRVFSLVLFAGNMSSDLCHRWLFSSYLLLLFLLHSASSWIIVNNKSTQPSFSITAVDSQKFVKADTENGDTLKLAWRLDYGNFTKHDFVYTLQHIYPRVGGGQGMNHVSQEYPSECKPKIEFGRAECGMRTSHFPDRIVMYVKHGESFIYDKWNNIFH